MTIKYGEITVIRNVEEETFVSYYIVRTLFDREGSFTDKDTIIILFDDETIYEVKDDNISNNNILFRETNDTINDFPLWFDVRSKKKSTVFYKYPTETPEGRKLDFKTLTNNYRIKHKLEFISSFYNIIYDRVGKDIFCIVKVKSNEDKPRFLVAYDDEYFDKNDIIYLVNCMLKLRFN